jgi:hypothetical protein
MVAAFIILWAPLQLFKTFRFNFIKSLTTNYIILIFFICNTLTFSYSILNPFIYAFNDHFFKNNALYYLCYCLSNSDFDEEENEESLEYPNNMNTSIPQIIYQKCKIERYTKRDDKLHEDKCNSSNDNSDDYIEKAFINTKRISQTDNNNKNSNNTEFIYIN